MAGLSNGRSELSISVVGNEHSGYDSVSTGIKKHGCTYDVPNCLAMQTTVVARRFMLVQLIAERKDQAATTAHAESVQTVPMAQSSAMWATERIWGYGSSHRI